MSRRLLNFQKPVLKEYQGFKYNLNFESVQDAPEHKDIKYTKAPVEYGDGVSDNAFDRYNMNLRMKLKDNVKIYNKKQTQEIRNQYIDGFKNMDADVSEKSRYNIKCEYEKIPAPENLSTLELNKAFLKRNYKGFGGFGGKYSIDGVSKEATKVSNNEKEMTIGDILKGENSGLYHAGNMRRDAQEKVVNDSKKHEVIIKNNTPQQHGVNMDAIYYKDFGKADQQTKIQNIPNDAQIPEYGKEPDMNEYNLKKKLDFTSLFK